MGRMAMAYARLLLALDREFCTRHWRRKRADKVFTADTNWTEFVCDECKRGEESDRAEPRRSDMDDMEDIQGDYWRVTYDPPGTKGRQLDEVVATNPKCVHLEAMDRRTYWMRIDTDGGRSIVLNFRVKGDVLVEIE